MWEKVTRVILSRIKLSITEEYGRRHTSRRSLKIDRSTEKEKDEEETNRCRGKDQNNTQDGWTEKIKGEERNEVELLSVWQRRFARAIKAQLWMNKENGITG